MDPQSLILVAILAFTMAAFAFEWMPLDLVALTSLALLLLFGLVTPREAISGFSNDAVITVMMMFVLSDGLVRSGIIAKAAHRIASLSGSSHWRASVTLLLAAAVLSAFINNVAALTILMPVALHVAKHYQISPSKLLLPLSYAAIFGGTCTLVGTSTNLLMSSLATEHGFAPFTMFEFLGLGAVLLTVGMLYNVAVPMRFLPPRSVLTSLTGKYQMTPFLTEIKVPDGSPLVGKTVVDERLHEQFRLNVLEVIRGRRKIATELRNTPLKPDDLLILRGAMDDIVAFREHYGLLLLTDLKLSDEDLADRANILAEVQLSPTSRLVGLTLKEIDFRRRYGCFVLALNRTGEVIRDKLTSIDLKQWDSLLLFGPRSRIEALHGADDFIPLQELELRLRLAPRWWIPATLVPAVVLLASLGAMPILKASILGAVAMLVTGCLTIQQAYKAINWTVIFLVAAILPMGTALVRTGLADTLGRDLADLSSGYGPLAVVATLYLTTALLTEVVSNNSTAVLMVPIAITTAERLGLDPKALLMAVTFAASSSFLTPMGYKTNAMVYGPGGYRLVDYLRAGAPLKLVFWLLSVLLIPFFWPLHG